MADLSDVEEAVLTRVAAVLYPSGPTGLSALGTLCRVYRGWPDATVLNADLAAGNVSVTVFPDGSPTRLVTPHAAVWAATANTPSLVATVDRLNIDFGGQAAVGQVVAVSVDGHPYVYRVVAGDTAALIAGIMAQAIRQDRTATLTGPRIFVPGAHTLTARVVADAAARREVRRQEQGVRVTCWCPSPALRDQAAALIDGALAASTFIMLADGTQAHVTYASTVVMDQTQNVLLYRRDIIYAAEYPTVITEVQPVMAIGDLLYNASHLSA
jgi:hypothetical protein